MEYIAFDFETHKFERIDTTLTPTPVCISYDTGTTQGVLAHCDKGFEELITELVNPYNPAIRIAHNTAFDTGIIFKHFPHLVTKLFECFERGLFTDTMLREKMLNLSVNGWIDDGELPDGRFRRKGYSLADCLLDRFQLDLSDTKKAEDAWRLRYKELMNIPAKAYPKDAFDYALFDSVYALKLYHDQEKRRNYIIENKGFDPFDFEGRCQAKLGMDYCQFKTMISFDAHLISMQGLRVNKKAKYEVTDWLEVQLSREKLELLFKEGVLTEPIPEMPYANGAKAHVEECINYKTKKPKSKRPECECPVKVKAAVPTKCAKKELAKFAIELFHKGYIDGLLFSKEGKKDLEFLDKYKKYTGEDLRTHLLQHTAYISVAKEFLDDYAELDPVLAQYKHRQSLMKIKNTEIPRICLNGVDGEPAEFVYPSFDVLKKTSRFSSYGGKLYPSLNVQNIHAKMRQLILPRKGHWMYSIDYAALEFISAAWRFQSIGVESMYAKLINEGGDSHGYLAAQLAYALDPEGRMKALADKAGLKSTDYYEIYKLFMPIKEQKDFKYTVEGVPKLDSKGKPYTYFSYWRTFSKPVGLGIVGGMGYRTIASTAKVMFGLIITPDEAKAARDVDLKCLPEVDIYLKAIKKHCIDYEFTRTRTKIEPAKRTVFDENGNEVTEYYKKTVKFKSTKYVYDTPLGLRRPNCDFTAAANGCALQSPSTEGTQIGLHLLVRETFDPSKNSILYGNSVPTGFIHDEFIGDVTADPEIAQQVMDRMILCMNSGLEFVCTGLKSKAEPAIMVKEWSKAAYDYYDNSGNIIPFERDTKNDY